MDDSRIEQKTSPIVSNDELKLCLLDVQESTSAIRSAIGPDDLSGHGSLDFLSFTASLACKEPGAGSALTDDAFAGQNEYYGQQYLNVEESLESARQAKLKELPTDSLEQRKAVDLKYAELSNFRLNELKDRAYQFILPFEKD